MPIQIGTPYTEGAITAGQILSAGGLAALQRQVQLQQLAQQRDIAQMEIKAAAQRQQEAIQAEAEMRQQAADQSMKEVAYRAGFAQELQQQEYADASEKMKQQAQLDLQNWEYKYTTEDKKQVARRNNALKVGLQSGIFTLDEAKKLALQSELANAGVQPSAVLKSEQQKQMDQWEREGKGIGQEWIDEWGNVKTREADGTIKTQVPYEKTRDGIKAQLELSLQKEIRERRQQLTDATVEYSGPETSGVTIKKPRYTSDEVQKKIEDEYPTEKRRRQAERLEELLKKDRTVPDGVQWATSDNLNVEKSDWDLPDDIIYAQAFVRTMSQRFNRPPNAVGVSWLPKEYQAKYREMLARIIAYDAQKKSLQSGGVSEGAQSGTAQSPGQYGGRVLSRSQIRPGQELEQSFTSPF